MAGETTTFEIEGTTFTVEQLPAMAGFRLLERIRYQLGKSIGEGNASLPELEDGNKVDGIAAGVYLLDLLLLLPPAFVEDVSSVLFDKVTFSNEAAMTPIKLAGAEDVAFSSPVAVYEVLGRCLYANFSNITQSTVSRWMEGGQSIYRRILALSPS